MLISCQLRRLLILHQPIVEVLLAALLSHVLILVVLHLLVELLSVDLRHILHHHCDVFGIEGALRVRYVTANF